MIFQYVPALCSIYTKAPEPCTPRTPAAHRWWPMSRCLGLVAYERTISCKVRRRTHSSLPTFARESRLFHRTHATTPRSSRLSRFRGSHGPSLRNFHPRWLSEACVFPSISTFIVFLSNFLCELYTAVLAHLPSSEWVMCGKSRAHFRKPASRVRMVDPEVVFSPHHVITTHNIDKRSEKNA